MPCTILLGGYSPLIAELMAVREGIRLAVRPSLGWVVVLSDSLEAINLLRGRVVYHSETGLLVEEILELESHFSSIDFLHVNRKHNTLEDSLARHASLSKASRLWNSPFPLWLLPLLIDSQSTDAAQEATGFFS